LPPLWGGWLGAPPGRFSKKNWRAEPLRQPLADQAAGDVDSAARGIADNNAHGPRRIAFRLGNVRQAREGRGGPGKTNKLASINIHGVPPRNCAIGASMGALGIQPQYETRSQWRGVTRSPDHLRQQPS